MRCSTLSLVLVALSATACAPTYVLEAPAAFKRFEHARGMELITADGVMLEVREEENYPRAELPFWRDALRGHLDARGYALKSERCFTTTRGLPGCTLDFVVPRGAEDWVMSETLFVEGDTVYLVEVAGPFDRYALVEAALTQAMTTFAPRP
jgi:hypothetical protein